MAEWSKALDLGSSHFDGVGSNPTAAKIFSTIQLFLERGNLAILEYGFTISGFCSQINVFFRVFPIYITLFPIAGAHRDVGSNPAKDNFL